MSRLCLTRLQPTLTKLAGGARQGRFLHATITARETMDTTPTAALPNFLKEFSDPSVYWDKTTYGSKPLSKELVYHTCGVVSLENDLEKALNGGDVDSSEFLKELKNATSNLFFESETSYNIAPFFMSWAGLPLNKDTFLAPFDFNKGLLEKSGSVVAKELSGEAFDRFYTNSLLASNTDDQGECERVKSLLLQLQELTLFKIGVDALNPFLLFAVGRAPNKKSVMGIVTGVVET
eukprot:Colp12_sorted_trinity150504_noHs@31056